MAVRSSEYNRGYRGSRIAGASVAQMLGGAFGGREWMQHGLCTQVGPDLFFPEERVGVSKDNGAATTTAKEVCALCPVKTLCLEYAVQHPEEMDGVWGGTTCLERKTIRRERGIVTYTPADDEYMPLPTTLVCTKCEVELPIAEFGPDEGLPHGVRKRCRACVRAQEAA